MTEFIILEDTLRRFYVFTLVMLVVLVAFSCEDYSNGHTATDSDEDTGSNPDFHIHPDGDCVVFPELAGTWQRVYEDFEGEATITVDLKKDGTGTYDFQFEWGHVLFYELEWCVEENYLVLRKSVSGANWSTYGFDAVDLYLDVCLRQAGEGSSGTWIGGAGSKGLNQDEELYEIEVNKSEFSWTQKTRELTVGELYQENIWDNEVTISGTIIFEENLFTVEVTDLSGGDTSDYKWIKTGVQITGCHFAEYDIIYFNPSTSDLSHQDCAALAYHEQ